MLSQSKVKFSEKPKIICQKQATAPEVNMEEKNAIFSDNASSDEIGSDSVSFGTKYKLRSKLSLLGQYKLMDEKRKNRDQDVFFKEKHAETEPSTVLSSDQKVMSVAVDDALLGQLARLQKMQEEINYFINHLLVQYDLPASLQNNRQPQTVEEKLQRIAIILAQQASHITRLTQCLDKIEQENSDLKDQRRYLRHLLKDIADLSNNSLNASQEIVSPPYASTLGANSGR